VLQPDRSAKHPDAAAGFIIMEQVDYPVMSGKTPSL
jgi:proline racemase